MNKGKPLTNLLKF